MIPTAENLLETFRAINITSPYKEHFISQISNPDEFISLNAINLIYKVEDKIMGANTDYLALLDMMNVSFLKNYKTVLY
jgi:shikimate dehydrogenase